MRLSKIPEPPGSCRNNGQQRHRTRRNYRSGYFFGSHSAADPLETALGNEGDQRNHNNRHEHQTALKKVRPAHRQEPSQEGVENDNNPTQNDRQAVVYRKHRLEQLTRSD